MNVLMIVIYALILPVVGVGFLFVLKRPISLIKNYPDYSLIAFSILAMTLMKLAAPEANVLTGEPLYMNGLFGFVVGLTAVGLARIKLIKKLIT